MKLLLENWREFLEEETKAQQLLNEQLPKHAGPRITYPIMGPCNEHKRDSEKWNRCVDAERKVAKAEQGPKKIKVTPITSSRPEKCTPEEIANKTCYEQDVTTDKDRTELFLAQLKDAGATDQEIQNLINLAKLQFQLEERGRRYCVKRGSKDPLCWKTKGAFGLPQTLEGTKGYSKAAAERITGEKEDEDPNLIKKQLGAGINIVPGEWVGQGGVFGSGDQIVALTWNEDTKTPEIDMRPVMTKAMIEILPGDITALRSLMTLFRRGGLRTLATLGSRAALQTLGKMDVAKWALNIERNLVRVLQVEMKALTKSIGDVRVLSDKGIDSSSPAMRKTAAKSIKAHARALNALEAQKKHLIEKIEKATQAGDTSLVKATSTQLRKIEQGMGDIQRSSDSIKQIGIPLQTRYREAQVVMQRLQATPGASIEAINSAGDKLQTLHHLVVKENIGYKIVGGIANSGQNRWSTIIVELKDGTRMAFFKSSQSSYDIRYVDFPKNPELGPEFVHEQKWLPFGGFDDTGHLLKYEGEGALYFDYKPPPVGSNLPFKEGATRTPGSGIGKYVHPNSEIGRISNNLNTLDSSGRHTTQQIVREAAPNIFHSELDYLHKHMRGTKGLSLDEIRGDINSGLAAMAREKGLAFRGSVGDLDIADIVANHYFNQYGALVHGGSFKTLRAGRYFPGSEAAAGGRGRAPYAYWELENALNYFRDRSVHGVRESQSKRRRKNKTKLIIEVRKRKQTQLFNI
jgi:hypothetical protein